MALQDSLNSAEWLFGNYDNFVPPSAVTGTQFSVFDSLYKNVSSVSNHYAKAHTHFSEWEDSFATNSPKKLLNKQHSGFSFQHTNHHANARKQQGHFLPSSEHFHKAVKRDRHDIDWHHSKHEPPHKFAERPVVLSDTDRKGYWLFGDHATFVATGKETKGQFSLFDFTTVPQGGPLVHTHYREGEFAYILEGEVSYQLHDQVFTATAGSFVYEPKGHPHSFVNLGTTTARHLVFSFPSGLENLFAEAGLPGSRFSPPAPQVPSSEFLDANVKLLNKYGVDAQNSIIFAPFDYNSTKSGSPEVTLLRPGESKGAVSATITVNDGKNIKHLPVNFADGERLKTVSIPYVRGNSSTVDRTFNLALTDPKGGATIGMLQDKAVVIIKNDNNYTIANGNTPDSLPKVLPNQDSAAYWLEGDNYKFVATSVDTEGQFSLFDVLVGPQQSDSLLYAPADQGYFVLDGNVDFHIGDQVFNAAPNTFVFIPEGNPYALTNLGTTNARTLLFSTSSELENFISYLGTPGDIFNPPCNSFSQHNHTYIC
ncbi:cupin domain-containing protein [Nostoc sp. XA010]|uniref:cupin domain-containing protein n=1 Tax=Nostoc sp. XA010 TaxID=2780407 RepID=UPI001E38DE09|nr:cupin domain-containing protein [Nostoc sp. XA010]MCC5661745.1 cupin domain-containing protein [Nostoc sp. XA010]